MVSGTETANRCLSPFQSLLLQAHNIVEARRRYFSERREKLRSAKFHRPKGEHIISSFDIIDYGDEDFDPAAPIGQGIFDKFILQRTNEGGYSLEASIEGDLE